MNVKPLCSVFGECGGCLYQDISYEQEAQIKKNHLTELLSPVLNGQVDVIEPIVLSPNPYYYRNRLDLKLKRVKSGEVFIGFTPKSGRGVIAVDACPIADQRISDFIPTLKDQAIKQLPEKYRVANLTVRCGGHDQVHWGGIGKRSLRLQEDQYFWFEYKGRKIYYSLDTFFQANLSILPRLLDTISHFDFWKAPSVFYDLYGGVGFFGLGLIDCVDKTILIEENTCSTKVARYNVAANGIKNFEIHEGRVENVLPDFLKSNQHLQNVAMIDPPRAGLSESALELLNNAEHLNVMMYLSCNPQALARDLAMLSATSWKVQTIIPFDFFPKTQHVETLVVMFRN